METIINLTIINQHYQPSLPPIINHILTIIPYYYLILSHIIPYYSPW